MNRMTRDYCSKGKHPKWKAWKAKYDMSTTAWKWLGEFCTNCGCQLNSSDTVCSGDTGYVDTRKLEQKWSLRNKIFSRKLKEGFFDDPKLKAQGFYK